MKKDDKKEHLIQNLTQKRDKMLFNMSPEEFEEQVDDANIDYTSTMLLKFSKMEQASLDEAEKNAIVIGNATDKKAKPKRKYAKTKVAIGALVSAASIGLFILDITNMPSNAGIGNGILHFFSSRNDAITAYVTTKDHKAKNYSSYQKVPPEKRKLLWKFEHESIPLQNIEVTPNDNGTNIVCYYTTEATDKEETIFFNLGLDIPNDQKTYNYANFVLKNYKEITNYVLNDTTMKIYESTNSSKDERKEYLIKFYNSGMQYFVSGNLSLYELQGIAAGYLEFALE